MTDIIPVSDRAREAAAEYWDAAGYPVFYSTTKGGEADNTLLVQTFARFEQDLSTDKERLIEALREARLQLEYVDGRLPTGTTPAVIARIDAALHDHQS